MLKRKINPVFVFVTSLVICAACGVNPVFGELTLADLYARASATAERIKLAEEQVKISQTGKDKAHAALLPRFSAGGSVSRFSEDKRTSSGSLIQPESAGNWGVKVEQSLSLGGREFTALNLSEENIAKSKEDLRALKEEYLLAVSQSYFEVLRTQKSLEIARTNLERLKKHRDAAEKRLRLGEITKTGLLRAEGELSGVQSDFIRASNATELSRQSLMRLVGLNDDFKLKEPDPPGEELPTLQTIKERALSLRAEIKSFDRQKRIVQDQVKLAKSQYWPNLNLSVAYAGADQYPASATLNRDSLFGSVGIT
ncbi:MAG: TolC family protein, partial [Desulfuromonadales bacterium]|nr:TolC family protein [Desulfuromonadales bacterium]